MKVEEEVVKVIKEVVKVEEEVVKVEEEVVKVEKEVVKPAIVTLVNKSLVERRGLILDGALNKAVRLFLTALISCL